MVSAKGCTTSQTLASHAFGIYAQILRLAFQNRHRQLVGLFGGAVEEVRLA